MLHSYFIYQPPVLTAAALIALLIIVNSRTTLLYRYSPVLPHIALLPMNYFKDANVEWTAPVKAGTRLIVRGLFTIEDPSCIDWAALLGEGTSTTPVVIVLRHPLHKIPRSFPSSSTVFVIGTNGRLSVSGGTVSEQTVDKKKIAHLNGLASVVAGLVLGRGRHQKFVETFCAVAREARNSSVEAGGQDKVRRSNSLFISKF